MRAGGAPWIRDAEAHGDGGRLAVERAGRAPERVDEGPLHLVNRLRGKIGVGQPVRVVAQVLGRGVHESLPSHGLAPLYGRAALTLARGPAKLWPVRSSPGVVGTVSVPERTTRWRA